MTHTGFSFAESSANRAIDRIKAHIVAGLSTLHPIPLH